MHLLGQGLRHVGQDKARRNGIGSDAACAQFLGGRLHQSDNACFGGGVVRLPRVAVQPHDRRERDDRTCALAHHDRCNGMGEIERRLEVDMQDLVPLLLGHAQQEGVARDTRVVHHDVYASTKVREHLLHHRVRSLKVRRVAEVGFGLHAQRQRFGNHLLGRLGGDDIGNRDIAALLSKEQGNLPPDTACSTGDNGCFSGKKHGEV